MDRSKFVTAIEKYRAGERPYDFKKPNWFLTDETGDRYPLKYIFAMAAGIQPTKTHTGKAKLAAEAAGFGIVALETPVSQTTPQSKFWWVNHKQTHRDEFSGGYIWSPKTKRDGTSNQTYTNLTRVRVGDKIVSYAEGVIKAIGVVTKLAADAPIPQTHWEAAEYWGESGWEVLVEWLPLPKWIKPKDFIHRVAPLLPQKHSPLRSSGDGNQGCYLASISESLGMLIIQLAIEVDATAVQIAQELEIECLEAIETEGLDVADLTETEREQLSRARIGQGVFRQRVSKVEKGCRVTGVENLAFLVASHIKPWRDCDNGERLNGNNGLLLSPHVDRLFDRGWISFTDKGALMVAPGAVDIVKAWNLPQDCMSGRFNAAQRGFLAYHRAKVFLSS